MRDHVFDILRNKGRCAHLGGAETGRALVLGWLRLSGVDAGLVFTGEGHAPPPLTTDEAVGPSEPTPLHLDTPDWALPLLEARMGTDLAPLFAQFSHRAPVYLRVNTRKADRADAMARLSGEGIMTAASDGVPTALKVTDGARRIKGSTAYRDGIVELQDLSVQASVAAVPWPASGRILDFCAGGGGKSLAIATHSKATLFAHDAIPRRMSDLPERAARAGARIATLTTDDLGKHAPYDAVLCDVPCSGSGTWRRDPEAKWRLAEADLNHLVQLQARILDDAAPLVREDGVLVYMTCSLFHRENEEQVAAFLVRFPDWQVTMERVETPLTASDGFFTAVLRRRPRNS